MAVPRYDYLCRDCGASFELTLPMQRRDEASCPRCASPRVRRLVSRINILVRGDRADAAGGAASAADGPCCAPGGSCCGAEGCRCGA